MGVEREVIEEGDGRTYPKRGDVVTIHYTGRLSASGQKFDSSLDRGRPFETEIGVGRVIRGWDAAVPLMSLGEKAKLRISSDFAYGSTGIGGGMIPPNSDLEFEVELLKISSPGAAGPGRARRGGGPGDGGPADAGPAGRHSEGRPRRLWEIPKEERPFDVGNTVEVHGLQSEAASQLNGLVGVIVAVEELKGRYQVSFPKEDVPKSIKPENLKLVPRDSRWLPGDRARLVGLVAGGTPTAQLHAFDGSLATLCARIDDDSWVVQVSGRLREVPTGCLRVLSQDDEDQGVPGWPRPARLALCAGILATVAFAGASGLALLRARRLRDEGLAEAPGMWAALLGLSASSGAALWIASVAVFGHRLHQPLHDPEVRCPLLPELGVGPRSARALYRCGSLCAALLLAVQSALHWELSLPHLPGGQAGDNGFSFACLGLTAATGLALQGVFLWDARWSMPAVLHLLGHLLFLFSTWGLLAVGFALYLPEADRPVHFKYNWLDVREQHFQDAQEAASSRLLTLWHMRVLLALRHWLLARLPWFSCLIPVCYWMWERWWIKIKDASTAQMREVICTSHWLIILSLAALHISFGPELATAATLPAAVYA